MTFIGENIIACPAVEGGGIPDGAVGKLHVLDVVILAFEISLHGDLVFAGAAADEQIVARTRKSSGAIPSPKTKVSMFALLVS